MKAFVLSVVLAVDPTLLAGIKAKLVDVPVLSGHFEQAKQVKGFKRPLKSSGHFVVAKGKGVRWETEKPFASTLTVKPEDIVSKANGAEVFRLDASKEPVVRSINAVLFALLAGDVGALTEHFTLEGTQDAQGWKLTLTPKTKGLATVLTRIELKGAAFVSTVDLAEASGDSTHLELSDAKADESAW